MQKRACLPPSLAHTSLSSICEAFALYTRQIPLLFVAHFVAFPSFFDIFCHVAGAGSIASRRFVWAFAVSMNMNYGNCTATATTTTAGVTRTAEMVAVTVTFSRNSSVFCLPQFVG